MNNTNMSDKEIAAWQGLYEGSQIQIANMQNTIEQKDALIEPLKEIYELVKVLRAWSYTSAVKQDSAREHKLYPANHKSNDRQLWHEIIRQIAIYESISSPVSEKAK